MLLLRALVLIFFELQAISGQFYTILAPKVVRQQSDYHVAVTTMGISEPVTVFVELVGQKDSGGPAHYQDFVSAQPYVTSTVTLKIGDLGPGKYNLTVSGDRVFPFRNTTELSYSAKTNSIFVQTDKAVYKPGDKVQFRAIVLSSHLKPIGNSLIDVHITDGRGNRVKQFDKVETPRGVFTSDFELSSSPVMGEWKIIVQLAEQKFEKKFQVAEYVLPKFQVSLDLPEYITFKDSKFSAVLRAKYTYGQPVKGEATIAMHSNTFSDILQPIFVSPIRKILYDFDGKASVDFDIVKELNLPDDYEREIIFDVILKESLTGRKQNTTVKLPIRKHKYKMELVYPSQYFKPGLKYTAYVKLIHHDGSPVIDNTNPIKIQYSYSYSEDDAIFESHVVNNGMVELNFYPPKDAPAITIQGEYLDIKEYFPTISASNSPSNSYIQAYLKTENPKVNQDIEIEVNCTDPLQYFTYQVIGRGDVILANTVRANGRKTAQWRFLATYAMAPTAHVVIQFIKDGEIIADLLDIHIENPLQNFVNLDVTPTKLEPGRNLDINIETKPNSYVGLLGIDQSTLLLKSGNDLSREQIIDELQHYDPIHVHHEVPFGRPMAILGRRKRFVNERWAGSYTAQQTFDNAGTVLLTNGYVHENTPWKYFRGLFPQEEEFDMVPLSAMAMGTARFKGDTEGGQQKIQIRSKFPETWIWDDLQTGLMSIKTKGYRGQYGSMGERPAVAPGAKALKPDIGPPVQYKPVTRPPLAGPYAFSRIPKPLWDQPRVYLDSILPADTWIFTNKIAGYNGKTSLSKTVPDTITSWVISAFSLDPVYGLGLVHSPQKVTVFRPFFVSLDLPYSVIRGETVSIPVVVFNYMDKDVDADVTIENSGQFEFADFSNEVESQPKLELFRRKKISVGRNSGASTSFMITPKELGYIDIKVTARSALAGDAIIKKLLVKPEGETQYKNKAIFVDLRGTSEFKTNVTLKIPRNVVSESEHIEISAVGDILGPSITNLEHLIKMPFGCGEQNMLNFVPNIVVLKYLKNTNQLTKAIESKSVRFMEKGYQQELTYRHDDGSFSAFGKADESGSTWLTAFVAKSFIQARPFIKIDDNIILDCLDWLAKNQASNGSFPEVGSVSHKEMQGGAGKGLALTAYVLTTFLEGNTITDRYSNVIKKAVSYLNTDLRDPDDPYAVALVAYGLTMYNHPSMDIMLQILDKNAHNKDGMKWWKRSSIEEKNPNEFVPNSIDVEMTAYALMTYTKRGLLDSSVPIMKWLISQQNDEGGFASTQDTVVALGALADLAAQIASKNVDITASFTYKKGVSNEIRVNQGNSMILQKVQMPQNVREINITATGRGFAVVQVSYRYNVNVTGPWPLFTLDPQVDKNSDHNHLQLSVCSGFTGQGESNMAVMEVSLPSGYTVDSDSLPGLQKSENVKRVETKEGETVVVLYFDKMIAKEYCPTISAFRTHRVARQKPVPVTVYDYYDQSRKARVFYEPRVATLCDICQNEDCRVCQSSIAGSREGDDKGSSSALSPLLVSFYMSLTFIVYTLFN